MKTDSFSISLAMLVCAAAVSSADSAPKADSVPKKDTPFSMACGAVQSVGAPEELSGKPQFFGVTLMSVKNYGPGTIPESPTLAVLWDDKNALGLAMTLSTAFTANKNVMFWWRPNDENGKLRHNSIACAMI